MGFSDVLDGAAAGVLAVIQDLVPPPPPAFADACATVADAVGLSAPIAVFMPLESLVASVGIMVATFAVVVAIRIFRIGVSVGSGGGGA